MSETPDTITPAVVSSDPQYADAAAKSEVSQPLNPSPGAESLQQDDPIVEKPKAEDKPKPPREDPLVARIRQQSAKIAHEAQAREAAEEEVRALRARYEPGDTNPQQPKVPTQADLDRMIAAKADEVATQRQFVAECNKIAEAGKKEFADDFTPALATLWGMIDGADANGNLNSRATSLIEAAMEADKPAAVLYHLGKNPGEATRIAALSPAKMGAAVAKLSVTLEKAAVVPKPISRAPDPLEPISGSAGNTPGPNGPKEMGNWIKWREEQVKASRA